MLVLGLAVVLGCRLTPSTGHLHLADVLAYVLPQLLAAFLASGVVRTVVRRSSLGDGPLQSTAVLLVGLGAFELVGIGLDASHAVGAHGLIDHGGWTAIPIALGLGSAIGLLACAATVSLRRRHTRAATSRTAVLRVVSRLCSTVIVPSGPPIARNLAGRAPPVLSR